MGFGEEMVSSTKVASEAPKLSSHEPRCSNGGVKGFLRPLVSCRGYCWELSGDSASSKPSRLHLPREERCAVAKERPIRSPQHLQLPSNEGFDQSPSC